jgi:hypothetical protein
MTSSSSGDLDHVWDRIRREFFERAKQSEQRAEEHKEFEIVNNRPVCPFCGSSEVWVTFNAVCESDLNVRKGEIIAYSWDVQEIEDRVIGSCNQCKKSAWVTGVKLKIRPSL